MVRLSDLMPLALLREDITTGMIELKAHPDPNSQLFILDYSRSAQFSRHWNEATTQCRGLIVHGDPMEVDSTIVTRTMPKFFNVTEHDLDSLEDLPLHLPFEVTLKLDGSLGTAFTAPDRLTSIATRGSFTSDQALWATAFYRSHYNLAIPKGVSLMFEIIYPQNRIVVDYGTTEDLFLIAALSTDTGADLPLDNIPDFNWPGPKRPVYPQHTDLSELLALLDTSDEDWDNTEGFVIRFIDKAAKPSVRAKAKYSTYVHLHKIITNVSSKTIWEHLSKNLPLDELLENVPDEFDRWVHSTIDDLTSKYQTILTAAQDTLKDPRVIPGDAKKTAEFINTQPNRTLLWVLYNGKDPAPFIWKQIRPDYERPFRTDPE